MFEDKNTPTILGLAASEWEAVSLGVDGALDGDTDWQTSLAKMKGGNTDATYQTCVTEIHYFRTAFTTTRYLQNHWTGVVAAITAAVAGVSYIRTQLIKGG